MQLPEENQITTHMADDNRREQVYGFTSLTDIETPQTHEAGNKYMQEK